MTPREEQVAKIKRLEKTLSTCRPNQKYLIKDLKKGIKNAKRDLAMYDRFQLEAEENEANKC